MESNNTRQVLAPHLLRRIIYKWAKGFFYLTFRIIWRMHVEGIARIPKTGPVIIAPNHVSNADPPVVGCAVPRSAFFFAKKELFDVPVLGWGIRQVNAFPVRRMKNGDISAIKKAREVLENGQVLFMFPEGRRQREGTLGRAKPGVGLLAGNTGAVVVPVYARHTSKLWKLRKITLIFGYPMEISPGEDYGSFSQKVVNQIAKLRDRKFGHES